MTRKIKIYFTYTDTTSSNPYKLWLSNHLLTYLGIQLNEKLWLRFGSERILVTCNTKLDESYFTLSVPKEIQKNHHLPVPDRYHTLTYIPLLKELRIGPIIAVLADKTGEINCPFGKITAFSKEIASLCNDHLATFYLFSLQDVHSNWIHGYTIKEDKLTQTIFPYPDIIYNRISSRTSERSEACVRFFEHCQDFGIPYFNDHFISKWDVFHILVERDALAAYLPETHKKIDEETLMKLMTKHVSLFLKPDHGSEGRGIIRITKETEGKFKLESSKEIDPPLPSLSTKGVLNFINQFVPMENYIIQQGIPLMTHSNGNVDFRILCNRNEKGDWRITSSIARVSDANPIVTNMSYGAKSYPLTELLSGSFETAKAKAIKGLLYELSFEVAESLHLFADGIFGEFGIDFGIDKNGHPWILEVNSKPSKHYTTALKRGEIRPSALGVFLFAHYLYTHGLSNEFRKEYDHA
ncbi:YheC/YheD family protein [Alkalihalobacillus sp. TS-13]|uniref:YheC/YheD family endospore coat-associated protein n=1 Tax=Alkalihalobacillus sp. TS-13 TaxID=2842455 RepID=UPI001C8811DC|nr:YheC/YheD family protein [Alkalihalobacillus sp. TS-13]